jgi:hypothetical protein
MKSLELSKGGFLLEYVDEDGQVAWIAEHADIESDYVRQVLALEFEYMVGAGIITGVDDFTFGVYEPAELRGASKVVDTDRLARDAEERLAIPKGVADKVFEHELAFLKMRGLVADSEREPLQGEDPIRPRRGPAAKRTCRVPCLRAHLRLRSLRRPRPVARRAAGDDHPDRDDH